MKLKEKTNKDDVFVIPAQDNKYYLYSPLRRSLAVVNGAVVRTVSKYLTDNKGSFNANESSIIETLIEHGVLSCLAPDPPTFPENYSFQPHEVTLFLTSRCNLRCRYCYANAGHKAVNMPWEVAKGAIDLVAMNAGILGSDKFAIGFHGGGEPTLAWDILVRSVEYALEKANKNGIDVDVFVATNGVLSQKQRAFIAEHFSSVNISLDGPKDIQDHNRPKIDGSGSYEEVYETLKFFDQKALSYGIRVTITSATVNRMEEIVEVLYNNFGLEYLHLEPAWYCGRCLTTGEQVPSDESFINSFMSAVETGRRLGINIHYSGARIDVLTSKFCAAPGDSFTVLPEGIVTSCYEITELNDKRAEIFHYGKFDPDSDNFIFDQDRLNSLKKLSVDNIPFCQDCFCKWHCAGDCLAKALKKNDSIIHQGSMRCELNRTLTRRILDEIVDIAL